MKIEFKKLSEINPSEIIELMNHPLVRKHMPLAKGAFENFGFNSVTVLFPPTRTRIKGLLRLGFKPDGEVLLEGELFIRYRISRTSI